VRTQFQNSADGSGKFCTLTSDDLLIKEHICSQIISIMTNAI